MKKTLLILSAALILFSSCVSDGGNGTGGEGTDITSPDGPGGKYAKVKWQPVTSLTMLEGEWVGEDFTIIYPYKVGGKDYILIRKNQSDDSDKWISYANSTRVPIDTVWQKRFASMAIVYGKEYPLIDSNGIQQGLKISHPTLTKIYSVEETLIPELTIQNNLDLFEISKKNEYIKMNGTMKLFSSIFANVTYDNVVLENPALAAEENQEKSN